MNDGGADMVKVDARRILVRFAHSSTPAFRCGRSSACRGGRRWHGNATLTGSHEIARFVDEARLREKAGASLLDFRHSGPMAGPRRAPQAVAIPVIGGLGGGPWLDGRVRAIVNAIGYTASALDEAGIATRTSRGPRSTPSPRMRMTSARSRQIRGK